MSGNWQIAFYALSVLTLALGVGFLALARHVAALETRLPQPVPLELEQGPAVGTPLVLTSESGWTGAAVERFVSDGSRDAVLVFVTTSCSVCHRLVPDISRFARDGSDLRVAVVAGGAPAQIARFRTALREVEVIEDVDGSVIARFGVTTVPYAILLRNGIV